MNVCMCDCICGLMLVSEGVCVCAGSRDLPISMLIRSAYPRACALSDSKRVHV